RFDASLLTRVQYSLFMFYKIDSNTILFPVLDSSLDFYDSDSHYSSMPFETIDLTDTCIRPTLSDILHHFLIPILIANITARVGCFLVDLLLGRVLASIQSPSFPRLLGFLLLNLKNFILIASGFGLLTYHFRHDSFGFQLFTASSVILAS